MSGCTHQKRGQQPELREAAAAAAVAEAAAAEHCFTELQNERDQTYRHDTLGVIH